MVSRRWLGRPTDDSGAFQGDSSPHHSSVGRASDCSGYNRDQSVLGSIPSGETPRHKLCSRNYVPP